MAAQKQAAVSSTLFTHVRTHSQHTYSPALYATHTSVFHTCAYLQVSEVDRHEVHGHSHVWVGLQVQLRHPGVPCGEMRQEDSVGAGLCARPTSEHRMRSRCAIGRLFRWGGVPWHLRASRGACLTPYTWTCQGPAQPPWPEVSVPLALVLRAGYMQVRACCLHKACASCWCAHALPLCACLRLLFARARAAHLLGDAQGLAGGGVSLLARVLHHVVFKGSLVDEQGAVPRRLHRLCPDWKRAHSGQTCNPEAPSPSVVLLGSPAGSNEQVHKQAMKPGTQKLPWDLSIMRGAVNLEPRPQLGYHGSQIGTIFMSHTNCVQVGKLGRGVSWTYALHLKPELVHHWQSCCVRGRVSEELALASASGQTSRGHCPYIFGRS